jgi:hypothetical protein
VNGQSSDPVLPEARPRSVVARAHSRHRFAFTFFIGSVILFAVGPVVWCAGAAMVGVLTAWDLAVLAWVKHAGRRMQRGAAPSRLDVDYGLGDDCWVRAVPAGVPYRAQDRVELLARGSPHAAASAIAENLRRRMVLVTVTASLLGLLVLATLPPVCRGDSRGSTRTAINTARSAAFLWKNDHPDGTCPTVDQLKSEKLLGRDFSTRDAWGNPFELRCDVDEITGSSAGPDRVRGTADDIVIPVPDPP